MCVANEVEVMNVAHVTNVTNEVDVLHVFWLNRMCFPNEVEVMNLANVVDNIVTNVANVAND